MIEVIFNDGESIVAIKENSDRIYLVEGYTPSAKVEVGASRQLAPVPARWDREKLIEMLVSISELKRGLIFALKTIKRGESLDDIRDRDVKDFIRIVDEILRDEFAADKLLKLVDKIRDVDTKIQKRKRRSRS